MSSLAPRTIHAIEESALQVTIGKHPRKVLDAQSRNLNCYPATKSGFKARILAHSTEAKMNEGHFLPDVDKYLTHT